VLHAEELRERALELERELRVALQDRRARHVRTELAEGTFGGFADRRVRREAEVVVRAEVEPLDLAAGLVADDRRRTGRAAEDSRERPDVGLEPARAPARVVFRAGEQVGSKDSGEVGGTLLKGGGHVGVESGRARV